MLLSDAWNEKAALDVYKRQVQGESFSLIFVFLMGLALIAWKRFHSLPDEDVLVMFWTSCAASRIYRLTQRRNASDIVTLGISLAFLACLLYTSRCV